MPKGIGLSIVLHLVLFALLIFGLPTLFPKEKDIAPLALSVEVVPIGEFTNLKKSQKPLSEAARTKLTTEKAVPMTKKEAKKADPTPEPKPEDKPVPADAIAPPTPKEEKKKEEPKKDKDPIKVKPKENPKDNKQEDDDDFAALLSKLKQESKKADEEAPIKDKAAESNTSRADNYDPTLPLSMTEKDAIRNQFIKCWRMPAGAKNDYDLAVKVRVLLNPDGSVREAGLIPSQASRYQSDTFFRAAADAAIRAVQLCNPLQDLPAEKYDAWRDIELNFDPMEMLY